MSLASGARLGPYEILTLVGAGGMGEVYKARDTRLDRTVAVKILPPELAADPQFRERFDREARTISQLDHPHICDLHDVGEQDGTSYLVMQYLEGETLADRLAKGALPLDQALQVAIQIADALDKAHRAGITHRDLKPGNIMLARGGVKLLDFGLAKLRPQATGVTAGLSAVITQTPLTGQGGIVGTLQYMAPEQLEGKEADQRADIWAFGCVLYEMVTGQKAFDGASQASVIGAILKDHPPPIAIQPLIPSALDRVIKTCLCKDPEERWQTVRDLRRELTWIKENGAVSGVAAVPVARRARLIRGFAAACAGLVVGITATTLVTRFGRGRSTERSPEVTRAVVNIAPAQYMQARLFDRTLGAGRPSRTAMAWSPDGRSMVFSAVQGDRQQLYLRALDQLTAIPIPGTEGAFGPFFSPDGRSLGFWSDGALRKISVDGSGPATTIAETPLIFGASWGSDDMIVFSRPIEGLWRVSASGGNAQALTRPDTTKGELNYLLPQILPNNRGILFTVTHSAHPTWVDTEVVVQSLATGEHKVLIRGAADARYLRSGHVLYLRRGTLTAVPFDLQRLEVTGGAVALLANVMQAANMPVVGQESGAGQFSVSEAGSLVYVPGGMFPDAERSLVWVDRTGSSQPLPLPARAYVGPRLSPDGHRVVLWTSGGDRNIWMYNLSRGTLTRVTSEARNARPIWTPDGTRIAYGSASAGSENLFWRPADGNAPAERLTTSDYQHAAASWSPDGQVLVYVEDRPGNRHDIWALPLAGDRRPRAIVQTRFDEAFPDLSPDGRWLAYTSDESGRNEVYVQPYPGPGAGQQVSTDGGTEPAWSRDGRELYYETPPSTSGLQADLKMMVVPVAVRPTFTLGTPRMLFQGPYQSSTDTRGYDVTPDGRRFLMVQQKQRPPDVIADMILVQNWVEELKRKVPTK